jgi:hypothetical protein
VEDAGGVLGDLAVVAEAGDEAGEFVLGVDAPDDFAQGVSGFHGRGQCGGGGGVEVDGLGGEGFEDGVFVGALDEEKAEVLEEPDAFVEIVDAVGDRFDSLDSHGFPDSSLGGSAGGTGSPRSYERGFTFLNGPGAPDTATVSCTPGRFPRHPGTGLRPVSRDQPHCTRTRRRTPAPSGLPRHLQS